MYSSTCGHFLDKPVPRLERVSVLEVIKNYVASERTNWFSPVKPMKQLHCPPVTQHTIKLDVVWHTGWFFSDAWQPKTKLVRVHVRLFRSCKWIPAFGRHQSFAVDWHEPQWLVLHILHFSICWEIPTHLKRLKYVACETLAFKHWSN